MTPAPSSLSGSPYHEGLMSPSHLLSPDFRDSPIDAYASFSPFVRDMTLSPVPSQGDYSQSLGGYSPSLIISSERYRGVSPIYTPYTPASPINAATSTSYSPESLVYSPITPVYTLMTPLYSPTNPISSQIQSYSPTSPIYNPLSPNYSPCFSKL